MWARFDKLKKNTRGWEKITESLKRVTELLRGTRHGEEESSHAVELKIAEKIKSIKESKNQNAQHQPTLNLGS